MTVARLKHCAHWILFGTLLASCSTDPETNPSYGTNKCKGEPYKGFCIAKSGAMAGSNDSDASSDEVGTLRDAGHGPKDAGADTGVGAIGDGGIQDLPDSSFDDSGMLLPPPDVKEGADCKGMMFEPCYLGPDHTDGKGACKAGTRLCECESGEEECEQRIWGKCVGQVLPSLEICNNVDDDCNDEVDDGIALGSCAVPGTFGACEAGEERCVAGMGVVTCEAVVEAKPEECNGQNDDCDMETDEDTSVRCYDDGMPGCTPNDDGGFDCLGLCAPGTRFCDGGELGACEDAVVPIDEVCTDVGGTAANEDCDAVTDENCNCDTDGDTHPCYGGPQGTEQHEICHAGVQTCIDHVFGECEGEQRPEVETCANDGTNDDCDENTDEVEGRGQACFVVSNFGRCRNGTRTCVDDSLQCVTLGSIAEVCNSQDDDCDNKVDEAFNLDSDSDNCGECGNRCTGGSSCCAGNCVNLQVDRNHCGMCPTQCGAGLSCCGARCVNTNSDALNCSMCGHACGLLSGCHAGSCQLL